MKSNLPEKPTFGFSDPELQKRFVKQMNRRNAEIDCAQETLENFQNAEPHVQLETYKNLINNLQGTLNEMHLLGIDPGKMLKDWTEGMEKQEEEKDGC